MFTCCLDALSMTDFVHAYPRRWVLYCIHVGQAGLGMKKLNKQYQGRALFLVNILRPSAQ